MGEIVLALFAHPDDEVLGCGGTLAKHVAAGAQVHARFLSTGVGARKWKLVEPNDGIETRLAEMRAAAKVLGLTSVDNADLPDQRFDTVAQLDVNRQMEAWLAELKPTIIYTHSPHDLNRDHRITAEAVMVATRPWKYEACCVFGCEIPGSADGFLPVLWEKVREGPLLTALASYKSELMGMHDVWPVQLRCRLRGQEAGMEQAEAFEVLRWVR